MKRILINILEISFGILVILLIIVGIKYRTTIWGYFADGTKKTMSAEVVTEQSGSEKDITNTESSESDEADSDSVIDSTGESGSQDVQTAETTDTTKEQTIEQAADATPVEVATPKLVFTGDILLTGYLLTQYDNSGIGGIVSADLVNEMTEADVAMVNEEFPFSTRGTAAEDKQYTFRIEPDRVSVFKDLGIDIVTLANNHTLDYGQEALIDTFTTLNDAQIGYVGAGNNYEEAKQLKEFQVKNKKIGVLAASRVMPEASWAAGSSPGVFSTYDSKGLIEEIKAADPNYDVVIVYVHWGIEKNEYPEDYQRQLAKAYIDAGADMVIGSHPHVLQGFEYYNGKPIVYSLGNFVFGSQIPKTVLLQAEIGEDNQIALSVTGCATNSNYILKKAEKPEEIYQYLTEISTNATVDEQGNITEKK